MSEEWGTTMYETEAYKAEQRAINKMFRAILDDMPINKIKPNKDIPPEGCLSAGPTESYADSKPCFDTQKKNKMTDFTKPVQTRNGLPVTIITTEGRGLFPIIGYMGDSNYIESWLSNGKGHKHKDSCYDLINVPEKRVGYINIFQHENSSGVYKSRGSADKCGLAPRIACIRVEYTDGQFDD